MDNNSNTSNSAKSSKSRGEKSEGRSETSNTASDTPKSLSAIIGQSLAQESQEGVERVFSQLNAYLTEGKEYINENPKEAAALAVSLGVAAWALTCTKPGRRLFETSATFAVPQITKWLSSNFSGLKH